MQEFCGCNHNWPIRFKDIGFDEGTQPMALGIDDGSEGTDVGRNVGMTVWIGVGDTIVGIVEGKALGFTETEDGITVGIIDGVRVGRGVGKDVGDFEGIAEGTTVGSVVGNYLHSASIPNETALIII
jgi:hypothetical protein